MGSEDECGGLGSEEFKAEKRLVDGVVQSVMPWLGCIGRIQQRSTMTEVTGVQLRPDGITIDILML